MVDVRSFSEREHTAIEAARAVKPGLFERSVQIDTEAFLQSIGIEGVFANQPIGYLKLWPQDFIVEEIREDGSLSTVDPETVRTVAIENGGTIWADLVKVGRSTIEVVDEISRILSL